MRAMLEEYEIETDRHHIIRSYLISFDARLAKPHSAAMASRIWVVCAGVLTLAMLPSRSSQ